MRWRRCGSPFQRNAVFNRRTWPLVHLTICSLRIRGSQRITPPVPKTIHSHVPRPPPKTSRFNKLWKRYDIGHLDVGFVGVHYTHVVKPIPLGASHVYRRNQPSTNMRCHRVKTPVSKPTMAPILVRTSIMGVACTN